MPRKQRKNWRSTEYLVHEQAWHTLQYSGVDGIQAIRHRRWGISWIFTPTTPLKHRFEYIRLVEGEISLANQKEHAVTSTNMLSMDEGQTSLEQKKTQYTPN